MQGGATCDAFDRAALTGGRGGVPRAAYACPDPDDRRPRWRADTAGPNACPPGRRGARAGFLGALGGEWTDKTTARAGTRLPGAARFRTLKTFDILKDWT